VNVCGVALVVCVIDNALLDSSTISGSLFERPSSIYLAVTDYFRQHEELLDTRPLVSRAFISVSYLSSLYFFYVQFSIAVDIHLCGVLISAIFARSHMSDPQNSRWSMSRLSLIGVHYNSLLFHVTAFIVHRPRPQAAYSVTMSPRK